MEINFVSTALILIALFIVYMSITETRCPMCRGWFVIYVADKKPRYYIYKCRKCDYQWTQASRKLTPLMLLCDVLGIRTTGPGSSVPTNTVDEQKRESDTSDFDHDVTQEETLEEAFPGRPWLTILFQPRSTIQSIVDSDPKRYVLLLAILTGIGNAFLNNEENVISWSVRFGLPASFALTVISGSLFGLIGFFVSGALFTWAGKGFGGKASSEEVRAAVAWSGMPVILSLSFVPLIFIIFRSELVSETYYDSFAIGLIWLPAIVIYIWWGLLFWKSYAEIQQFSLLKAFITIFLAFVAISFMGIILGFIIGIGIIIVNG